LGEEAKVQGEAITSLTQERDVVVATSGELAEEKAALEKEVEGLKKSVAIQYDEGFSSPLIKS
ncbi:hypothetical protein A2U01_0102526, partial [Trifolium medium]|nr:hypothetical protein [Trifolium medium]